MRCPNGLLNGLSSGERRVSARDAHRPPAASNTVTLGHQGCSTDEVLAGLWPDLDRPNVARMHDRLLGGCHNFLADRLAVDRLLDEVPQAAAAVGAARGFHAAAVRFLLRAGVRQFLDLGAGLPTQGSVGGIARAAGVPARVVYVDVDPVVVMHTRAVIAGDAHAAAVLGDVRDPARIFEDPGVTALLEPSRPVGALLGGVLHFVADADDPAGVVAAVRDRLAPGGYVAISHVTGEGCRTRHGAREVVEATGMPLVARGYDQVRRLFAGMDLVEPGVVRAGRWRAEEDSDPLHSLRLPVLVGVARVPDGHRRPAQRIRPAGS